VGGVPLVLPQRRGDGIAHHRMKEAGRLVTGEHLQADQVPSQTHGLTNLETGQARRVPQLAVTQHGERLSDPERPPVEATQSRRQLLNDTLHAASDDRSRINVRDACVS
jgi:hypothetical protein